MTTRIDPPFLLRIDDVVIIFSIGVLKIRCRPSSESEHHGKNVWPPWHSRFSDESECDGYDETESPARMCTYQTLSSVSKLSFRSSFFRERLKWHL